MNNTKQILYIVDNGFGIESVWLTAEKAVYHYAHLNERRTTHCPKPSIQVIPLEKCLKYFYWINVTNEEDPNEKDPKQLSYVTTINGKQYSYDKRWDTTEEISDEDDSLENCRRAIPSPHRTMTDVQDELNRQLNANN